MWSKDDPKTLEIRKLSYKSDKSYRTYVTYEEKPETAANCAICLIHQANYLLDRQLATLQSDFLEKGGFSEALYRARTQHKV
jgi:four helix bundle suffix protein